MTTIASGHSSEASIASIRSMNVGSNALRPIHMSFWPVKPWIT